MKTRNNWNIVSNFHTPHHNYMRLSIYINCSGLPVDIWMIFLQPLQTDAPVLEQRHDHRRWWVVGGCTCCLPSWHLTNHSRASYLRRMIKISQLVSCCAVIGWFRKCWILCSIASNSAEKVATMLSCWVFNIFLSPFRQLYTAFVLKASFRYATCRQQVREGPILRVDICKRTSSCHSSKPYIYLVL